MNCEFILGEEKKLTFEVKSRSGRQIVINDASYELHSNGEVQQSGKCIIDGAKLHCIIKPAERGAMYLEIEYVIPPETRKARLQINVV